MPNPSKGNTHSAIFKSKATPNQLSQLQILSNIANRLRQDNAQATGQNEEPYQTVPEIKLDQTQHQKNHLLVISLANANFGVSYKLLETMYQTSQRKFANY